VGLKKRPVFGWRKSAVYGGGFVHGRRCGRLWRSLGRVKHNRNLSGFISENTRRKVQIAMNNTPINE